MICTAREIERLSWYFENQTVGRSFLIDNEQSFPINLYNESGIHIEVRSADAQSNQSDVFNATSVLTATISSFAAIQFINCGTNTIRSKSIILDMLGNCNKLHTSYCILY